MPFTFSHPAIILPLLKLSENKISATALVIGSMSPDFEYFIKMKMEKVHGHSWGGMFYFDLPLTIILCFAFHLLVRDALILNLPELLKKRLLPFVGIDWVTWVKKRWYVLIYSAVIGIVSHLLWDACTHTHGFIFKRISILQGSADVFGVLIKKADLLQLISTLLGAFAIFLTLIWPDKNAVTKNVLQRKIIYWTLVSAIVILVLILRGGSGLGDFVATSISGGLIGIIITPLIMKKLNYGKASKTV